MPHLRKLPGVDEAGWNSSQNRQVLGPGQKTSFYLICGETLEVGTDPAGIADVVDTSSTLTGRERTNKDLSEWEKAMSMRKLLLTARRVGATRLFARLPGTQSDFILPLDVEVVPNQEHRKAWEPAQFSDGLRQEVQKLTLREAVIRVAEDQMTSAVGRGAQDAESQKYRVNATAGKWCGQFAWWCWQTAANLKGVANPLGANQDNLNSPLKALGWGIPSPNVTVLNFGGSVHVAGQSRQTATFADIGSGPNALEPGDICLDLFSHVCMIYTPPSGDAFVSLDGNQGLPAIHLVSRSLNTPYTGEYQGLGGGRKADRSYAFLKVKT